MSDSYAQLNSPLRWTSSSILMLAVIAAMQVSAGGLATISWTLVFAPIALMLAAVSFLWPRAGIYILCIAVYFRVAVPGTTGIYPADLLAFIVIGGGVVSGLSSNWRAVRFNPLSGPMAAILLVFAISLIGAHDLSIGATNWLRHVQMFGVILVISAVIGEKDITRILRVLLVVTFIVCLPTLVTAIQIGGRQRVFGIASAFFPFFLAAGIMYSSVAYLLSDGALRRWLWATLALTLALGIFVSQTREAMLHVIIGLGLIAAFVWVWAKRFDQPQLRRRVSSMVIAGVLVLLIVLSGSVALLETSANRMHQALEGHSNTIFIRLFLWRTGIQNFVDSPVLGIGIGQIRRWDEILPYWRFDPMSQLSKGVGAHNDLITYAAETGIIGLAALFWFFWRIVQCGWSQWRRTDSAESLFKLLVIWVPCLALIVRFFYGTHTFYSLGGLFNCIYFGMLIAYTQLPQSDRIAAESHAPAPSTAT